MKYSLVRQHNEEDCGAASLASVAKHYGKIFTINRIRAALGTGQQGTSLLSLKQGAELLGFNARSVKAPLELIERDIIPLPAILHWKGYHWVVFYGKQGEKYVIGDPAAGIHYLDQKQFTQSWSDGVMLILEKDPESFDHQDDEREKVGGLRRFIVWIKPHSHLLAHTVILNLALGFLSLASPFFMQILTDDILIRGDTQLLTQVCIAVIIMHLVSSILGLIQSNLVAHFAQRLELGLVLEFAHQLLRLPMQYYEARRSGEVVSRLEDIQQINQVILQTLVAIPSQFFIAIVSLAFMFFYSVKLSGLAIVIAMIMTISTLIFLPTLQNKIRSVMILASENQGVLVETFKGAFTLKTINAHPQLWEEFQLRFNRLASGKLTTLKITLVNSAFSNFVASTGSISLLWFGSSLVINQELTIGMLIAFYTMNGYFTGFISSLISFVDELLQSKTATQRLSEVIDYPREKDNHKAFVEISPRAEIICSHLNFHHEGRVRLLNDFSLTLPGGQVIGLIGKSGCGKSTLAKLIAGIYPLDSGNIRFGNYNQQDLSLNCLRQQVVLVPQDSHFWSRSIIENFNLGNPWISLKEVVEACQITGADEFISELPDKYYSTLGEFGANLSGGQKQRLAIARAIVNNPPILILDESTGALDPEGENQILAKLLQIRQGKTTILITHRPQVIKQTQWLVMLEAGQIKIQGETQLLSHHPDFSAELISLIHQTEQNGQKPW